MLRLVNLLFFQWLFVRLTLCQKREFYRADIKSASIMKNGYFSVETENSEFKLSQRYAIQYWILPISGWFNFEFTYLGKPEFLNLTSWKEIK